MLGHEVKIPTQYTTSTLLFLPNWATNLKYCLAVRSGKKSPYHGTGLGNRGHLKVLNDTKLILNEHE